MRQPLHGNLTNRTVKLLAPRYTHIPPAPSKVSNRRRFDDDPTAPTEPELLLARPTIGIASLPQLQHLRHVMRVIEASAPLDVSGVRNWLGFSTFLNYYFASTLRLFLGDRVVVRIMQIPSNHEFGAKLYQLNQDRYSLMLLADFDYWDRLLHVAVALPDIYFENGASSLARIYQRLAKQPQQQLSDIRLDDTTMRCYQTQSAPATTATKSSVHSFAIRDGNNLSCSLLRSSDQPLSPQPPPSSPAATDTDADDTRNAATLDLAVAGLCLVHRFEMLLERDFRNKVPNYVTLAKMFTRNVGSVNPFRITLFSN